MLLFIFIIILLGLGSWAAWYYGFKKDNAEPAPASDAIVPIQDSVDTSLNAKNDSLAEAQRITDSISECSKKSC